MNYLLIHLSKRGNDIEPTEVESRGSDGEPMEVDPSPKNNLMKIAPSPSGQTGHHLINVKQTEKRSYPSSQGHRNPFTSL